MIIDGTSSVTFLPFIVKNFENEYIIPYYIGESLFQLLPSLIAIFQGLGDNQGCRNETSQIQTRINETYSIYENKTTPKTIDSKPLFSAFIYFNIIFVLTCFSIISFILINHLPICKKVKKKEKETSTDLNEYQKSLLKKEIMLNEEIQENIQNSDKIELVVLYTIIFFNMFVFYGVLTGLSSYASLPYGHSVFHLAVNLSMLF